MRNQNGDMKKNVFFAPFFLYNLALITHDTTTSVNLSISEKKHAIEKYFGTFSHNCVFHKYMYGF